MRLLETGIVVILLTAATLAPAQSLFIRGDVNNDGFQDISDAIFLLAYGFSSGPAPTCFDAADLNDDGQLDAIPDTIYLLSSLFSGGALPPAPYPLCGDDPTTDPLDCVGPTPCGLANQAPEITTPAPLAAIEASLYEYDVDATDPDGDPVEFTLPLAPSGAAIDSMSGLISWVPDALQPGPHDFTVRAEDPSGLADEQSFTVIVTDVNQPPAFTSTAPLVATELLPYTYDADATDPDPGDGLTFSLASAPIGAAIDGASGLLQWTPTALQTGAQPFTVRVEDDGTPIESADQSFTVIVTDVNQPPAFTSTAPLVATELLPYTYDADATDPDPGDGLTFSLASAPIGAAIDGASGLLQWTPTALQTGAQPFTVRVEDDGTPIESADQSFTVIVTDVNQPPAFTSTAPLTGSELVPYAYDADATDPDPGDGLTFTLVTAPTGATIDGITGVVAWTPTALQTGGQPFTVRVEDDGTPAESADQSFTVVIADVNQPPAITSTPNPNGREGLPYPYDTDASDPDPGDTITFALLVAPAGATIDPDSGVVTWTPDENETGPQAFQIDATDDGTPPLTASQSFTVDILAAPDPLPIHRVNCGGPAFTDAAGRSWNVDLGYQTGTVASTADPISGVEDPVAGTSDARLYQSERRDALDAPELVYTLPVDPGSYRVRLHFAEFHGAAQTAGARLFDVFIEGARVLDDFDIAAVAGGLAAHVEEVTVDISDGAATIELLHGVGDPKISGIEVLLLWADPGVLSVTGTEVDFGAIPVGAASSPATVTLRNLGTQPITVSQVSVPPPFTVSAPAPPFTLAPGSDQSLSVTYSPTGVWSDFEGLGISHDGSNSPLGVSVSGRGVDLGAGPISFLSSTLSGESSNNPTTLDFGPDGRLYVGQQDALIRIYTIERLGPQNYTVTSTETITSVRAIPNHDDDGTPNPTVQRQLTGLMVTGTAGAPVIYVSSSDWRIVVGNDIGTDTNSGVISRLTWNGSSWDHLDLVRGLPRSNENHSTNGMALDDATGLLYVASGGHTNQGAPSNNFAYLPEFALSGAILTVDLLHPAIGSVPYDLPTLDDEDRPGAFDTNDPFGGNNGKNMAIFDPSGPVQVHSPGWRNIFDVCITAQGRLYTCDNGPNGGWGGEPIACSNQANDPGSTFHDNLHFVSSPGYYGGHPNPTRADPANTFNPSQPQTPMLWVGGNPVECEYRSPGPEDGALATFSSSTNGLCEYTANNFGGSMVGNLLLASFSDDIFRISLTPDGAALDAPVDTLFSNFTGNPLDVIALGDLDIFPGTIWTANHGSDTITVFEPVDFTGVCTAADDPALDEDSDGYDNADELANGTHPCNPASIPSDADGDLTSDLLDPDDDNDGLLDDVDPFAIDPDNGLTTYLPLELSWDNGAPDPGGFLGLGFTGLMTNGSDYRANSDLEDIVPSGAAGLVTIQTVGAGDAYENLDDQINGLQLGLAIGPTTPPFTIASAVKTPFAFGTPSDFQSLGITFGLGTQDDYLRLVCAANGGAGGVELGLETSGVHQATVYGPGQGVSIVGAGEVRLFIDIDPAAATAQPRIAIDGGAPLILGLPVSFPANWLTAATGPAVGLIATSRGAAPFAATWDYLNVTIDPGYLSSTRAELEVTPTGGLGASTFGSGAFRLTNLSTGGERIEEIRFDISSTFLPDIVFDPLGGAGDATAKCLVADSGSGATGYLAPSDPCLDPFDIDHDGGFDRMTVRFGGFDPGETFTFSVDIDPTSIQGAPGAGGAGSVSGLELIGAVVSIAFDNGEQHVTTLGRVSGSLGGSRNEWASAPPPAPSIELVGFPNLPAVTATAAHTVRIFGPPGESVVLWIFEGGLFDGVFEIGPYEANSVVEITEHSAIIGGGGSVDVPVIFSRNGPESGIQHILAVIADGARTGPSSNRLVIEYEP